MTLNGRDLASLRVAIAGGGTGGHVTHALAIADAFDSMTAESCYREFRNKEEAIAELFAQGDIQFDLEMVRSFAAFIETHNVWTSG